MQSDTRLTASFDSPAPLTGEYRNPFQWIMMVLGMHHDPAHMQLNLITNFYHMPPNTEVHLNRG